MKVAAVICEYNPIHTGHEHHLRMTKEAGNDFVICIMSGNYVQRGDVAIFSKWSRAKAAIYAGADLVLELPTPYALMSAEGFACAAIQIANATGVVSTLSFGSECSHIGLLTVLANILLCPQTESLIKDEMALGFSYAVARERVVKNEYSDELSNLLRSPNNILAVEYIKCLVKNKYDIEPITFERTGADYHSDEQLEFMSASGIRKLYKSDDYKTAHAFMPNMSKGIFEKEIEENRGFFDIKRLDVAILSHLRCLDEDKLCEIEDVREGLHRRIMNVAKTATSFEEVVNKASSKRYTKSRIRRIVLRSFLGITKDKTDPAVPYVKVLAFNDNGRELLRNMRETCKLPIISKPADSDKLTESGKNLLELENCCTDIYSLAINIPKDCGEEFRNSPAYVN